MNNQIAKAIETLNKGGIIIFPTDTAFGIGCRIDKEDAIKKLFKIRKRPRSQATPVLINSIKMATDYVTEIPEEVNRLMQKEWPGALTIVLPCKTNKIHAFVRGGGNNIGIRIPDNKAILEIIGGVGVPILGPSANFHGDKTPYEYKDLDPKLVSLVDYVLEGECKTKQPSTVVDCSKTPWTLLRRGAVSIII